MSCLLALWAAYQAVPPSSTILASCTSSRYSGSASNSGVRVCNIRLSDSATRGWFCLVFCTSLTNVPDPIRLSVIPTLFICCIASRSAVRDTPNRSHKWRSAGNLSPFFSPSRSISEINCSITCVATFIPYPSLSVWNHPRHDIRL